MTNSTETYQEDVQEQEHRLSEGKCTENLAGMNSEHDQIDAVSCSPYPQISSPRELGRRGEEAAARFLRRKGFEILERNWTCFAGEADIIARTEDTLCFIEVKTRSQVEKGFPAEAVNAQKRDRYERIAACYLKCCDVCDIRVRFDVISILVLSDHRAFLRYHTNAFGVD